MSRHTSRHFKRDVWVVALVVAGFLFATAAVVAAGSSSANSSISTAKEELPTGAPVPTKAPSDPLSLEITGHRVIDTAMSVSDSTVVIIGTVKKIGESRWTTGNGKRPANPHWSPQNTEDGAQAIFRPMLVQVDEYLVGDQPQRQLHVYNPGGKIGQDAEVWQADGLYDFTEGERVVLFLAPHKSTKHAKAADGRPFFDVQEHYTITPDNQVKNFRRTVSLEQLRREVVNGEPTLFPTEIAPSPVPSPETFPTSAPAPLP